MTDGPKRFESELTVVIDRSKLPPKESPVSTIPGPTIEHLAEIERARRDAQDATETLVACPGPCGACRVCRGKGMVSAERAAKYRREQALIADADAADEMNQDPDPPDDVA